MTSPPDIALAAPAASRLAGRTLHKGQQTRAAILDAALGLASQMGLEGLSIGALAEVTQMSKSGVFAHFGSREELQISVIREYHARFEDEVFYPAITEPRGEPRLRALVERWLRRVSVEVDSGCIYISGAVEFDDRPGPVRDALAAMVRDWHAALERAIRIAIAEGDLRPDTDPLQMLFERWIRRVSVEVDSGCIYISGAVEFDDRPGPVRDALASMVRAWQAALERAISLSIEAGHLKPDTDALQMLFEVHGLILALHHDARFLRLPGAVDRARKGFDRILQFYLLADPQLPAR